MAKTFTDMSEKELTKELAEYREELRDIRLGRKAPSNPQRTQTLRRNIARIMTEFSARKST